MAAISTMLAVAAVGASAASTVAGSRAAKKANKTAEQANQDAAAIAARQQDMAEDQYDKYQEIYEPIEREIVQESRGLGSIANQNKGAQQAAADVAGSFANVRERLVSVPGANPSSQAFLQEQNRINLAEAAASAAAQTGARQQAVDKGRAAQTDALSLGKGLPAQASSNLAAARGGLSSAASFYESQSRNAQQGGAANVAAIGQFAGGLAGNKKFQDWASGTTTAPAAGTAYDSWQTTGNGMPQ